jgi:hypothetical protein
MKKISLFNLNSIYCLTLIFNIVLIESNGQLTKTPLTNQLIYGQPSAYNRLLIKERIDQNEQQNRQIDPMINNHHQNHEPYGAVFMNNLWPHLQHYQHFQQQMPQNQNNYQFFDRYQQQFSVDRNNKFHSQPNYYQNYQNQNRDRIPIIERNPMDFRRNFEIPKQSEIILRQPLIPERKKFIENQDLRHSTELMMKNQKPAPIMEFQPMARHVLMPLNYGIPQQSPIYPQLFINPTPMLIARNDFENKTSIKRINKNSNIENKNHDLNYNSNLVHETWKQRGLNSEKHINKSEDFIRYYNRQHLNPMSENISNRSKYLIAGITAGIVIIIILIIMILIIIWKRKISSRNEDIEGKRSSSWTTNTLPSQMSTNAINSHWIPSARINSRTQRHIN